MAATTKPINEPSTLQTEGIEKFQKTVMLLLKNKVNKSNAFENRMIGEIDEIFNLAKANFGEEQWRQFSTVLDACGKIYGYCVDYLHEEVFKILGGVNRTIDSERLTDQKAPILARKIIQGGSTLEQNEFAINFKEFDKCLKSDPFFSAMSKKFDTSNASSLLLNNTSINAEINLILTPDDIVIGKEQTPMMAEVNLEGIVTFSENELVKMVLSQKILDIESQLCLPTMGSQMFEPFWKTLNEHIDIPDILNESVSSVNDEVSQEILEDYTDYVRPETTLEERIINDVNLNFLENSSKVFFPRNSIVTGVTQKVKKRKRKERVKDEIKNEPFCILKIEEDTGEKNLLSSEERAKYYRDRGSKIIEKGYKESRLGQLFTRNGKFVGISLLEHGENTELLENPEPLSIDPFAEPIPYEPLPKSQNFMNTNNIKFIKDSFWKVIESSKNSDFLSLISYLPSEATEAEIEHLSVHTCFVTMLHLANEHSLTLEKFSDCNFLIKK
ncbi:hypothetical protein SteCoe_31169 [Stentor coeruleus]|uniref:Condensin complex subunit 2 n=1 Tax=Stentor coeruleus TaxID=5963 RepID=A0A1R2B1W6_9CILI|nr:hypothetical protein SteCoe_31169 [Stentor coeruleus]